MALKQPIQSLYGSCVIVTHLLEVGTLPALHLFFSYGLIYFVAIIDEECILQYQYIIRCSYIYWALEYMMNLIDVMMNDGRRLGLMNCRLLLYCLASYTVCISGSSGFFLEWRTLFARTPLPCTPLPFIEL